MEWNSNDSNASSGLLSDFCDGIGGSGMCPQKGSPNVSWLIFAQRFQETAKRGATTKRNNIEKPTSENVSMNISDCFRIIRPYCHMLPRYYFKLNDCPFNIAVWTRPSVETQRDSWFGSFRCQRAFLMLES